jgi:hypothetical protein
MDYQHMVGNMSSTCDLADQVSYKVHKIDLVQSRVNSALLRIDAIVNRSNYINGVRKSLETEDFESAAKYVQTFLQIDVKYKDSGTDQRDQMLAAKDRTGVTPAIQKKKTKTLHMIFTM